MDAQGWVAVITALGILICNVIAAYGALKARKAEATAVEVKGDLVVANKKVDAAAEQIAENTDMTKAVATTTAELHKQGNSRWDEIKQELHAARKEIADLQQLRVDDAKHLPPPTEFDAH